MLFSGEGSDYARLTELAKKVKEYNPSLKTGVYSGRENLADDEKLYKNVFDYIKTGPYIEEFGPLNKVTTNQRLIKKEDNGEWVDITNKFWRKKV